MNMRALHPARHRDEEPTVAHPYTARLRALPVIAACAILLVLLHLLAAPIPFAASMQPVRYDLLWTDALLKQISGYSALVFFIGCMLLALRKRVRQWTFGTFQHWRLLHSVCAVLGLVTLVVHSGLRLGSGVNLWLALAVLGVVVVGAANIVVMALLQQCGGARLAQARRWGMRAHVLTLWPLPVLLGYHIFTVYYF